MTLNTREKRVKASIKVSLIGQFVTIICGVIIPQYMIRQYGSEAYGATSSIAQFLSYISLLEGGIGGVARAALYKPIAERNFNEISEILTETKRLFKTVALIFIPYVIIIAASFKYISHVQCFDWLSTFFLVISISISTFAQYFIGITYSIFLQADQRAYITSTINIFATVLNTIAIIILVKLNVSLILVKLSSSLIFTLKPILMWRYVSTHYPLIHKTRKSNQIYLKQKWSGLGQHIAFFIYSNTDIAVLTIFSNLKQVSVYSIYYMIVSHIESLTNSFSSGMEAVFGDMLAKNEGKKLNKTFDYFETLISEIVTILYPTMWILIIPFIKIYTLNISDENYIEPLFAAILISASAITCLRIPYHNIIIAAGHFRSTQLAAYGEAIINITLSIILVINYGIVGVAIGTLIATTFRFIYYVIYLSKHIIGRNVIKFLKRAATNILVILLILIINRTIQNMFKYSTYIEWAISGIIIFAFSLIITLTVNYFAYKDDTIKVISIALKHNRR